jgi:hypothetical protein
MPGNDPKRSPTASIAQPAAASNVVLDLVVSDATYMTTYIGTERT